MKTLRIGAPLWHLLVVALAVLGPCRAHAGLLGDTVTATLTDEASATAVFGGSAQVVAVSPPPEFTGVFSGLGDSSTWTLDLTDTGFILTGACPLPCNAGSDLSEGLTLSISGLDFTPPANLVTLSGLSGDLASLLDGAPQITSSSVVIRFLGVDLGTAGPATQAFSATFVTEPQATATPLPATLALLAIGALAASLRRFRARI